jgi:hypothetical protein
MKKETVKLTLEVPKGVIDFLTDLFALGGSENSVSKFIKEEVARLPDGIMGSLPNTWLDMEYIRKKHHLEEQKQPWCTHTPILTEYPSVQEEQQRSHLIRSLRRISCVLLPV